MKRALSFILLAYILICLPAAGITIDRVKHAGPFTILQPVIIDSLSANQQRYSTDKQIETPLSLSAADSSPFTSLRDLHFEKGTLNLATFHVNSLSYTKATIAVKGAKLKKVFADGKEVNGEVGLQPGFHTLNVKFVADSTNIDIDVTASGTLQSVEGQKPFTMGVNLLTRNGSYVSLSPSGRWALAKYSWYDETYKMQYATELIDLTTRRHQLIGKASGWMPSSERYYYTEKIGGKTNLITIDPATGQQHLLAKDIPSEQFVISPTEDYLITYTNIEGPKKEDGVFEIVHPDDRQPGWRSRQAISRYDLKTGFVQPLTYGNKSTYVSDISMDGRYLLLMTSSDSLTQRPTTRYTFLRMDVRTLNVDTLIVKDGFIAGGKFLHDSNRIIFKASPESFGNIGNLVPKTMTPSNFDYHLYLFDANTHEVRPLTAAAPTCVKSFDVSAVDGNVYYSAERADSVLLYRLDMKTLRSVEVKQPCEVLGGFSLATKSKNILICGTSACTPYRVYNLSNGKTADMVLDSNKELYADIKLGTCHPWKFTSSRGDVVTGHYYLPADFDSSKKYPVIVHYYGGCSPTSRRFGGGSHYPSHYWNALGYITFIVNPSGATGFGQEWAARHVNTMGEGPAQDIIDATRQFVKDIPQVDADRIGCVSASYGGFMTQYMLTKDNPFACGISHAGISDHTSYWGEGYWGYSYSETSAANTYPWTRKDLYVDRSPLYNADKITKPLLFTHGTADTNVPIGESIQMYTALRLLGRPTAFIQVEGENHGIMDPVKRTKWVDSMLAWFQRYLKDDPSWWDAIYTPKKL